MWKALVAIIVVIILCGAGVLTALNMSPSNKKSKVEVVKKDESEAVAVDGLRCFDYRNNNNTIYLCKDEKTGCQYFKYGWQGSLIYRKGTCNDARFQ